MAFENPPYEVLDKQDRIELRQYGPYVVAEVVLQGTYEDALSQGFRILADYIFGNNRTSEHIAMTVPVTSQAAPSSEKIAMTAPVTAQMHGAGAYRVAFMMPTKYTMETLPRPVDSRIAFRSIEAHRAAAIRFSGSLNDTSGGRHWAELETWVRRRGLAPDGSPLYANYSPPWIPPPFRRNEIIVPVLHTSNG